MSNVPESNAVGIVGNKQPPERGGPASGGTARHRTNTAYQRGSTRTRESQTTSAAILTVNLPSGAIPRPQTRGGVTATPWTVDQQVSTNG